MIANANISIAHGKNDILKKPIFLKFKKSKIIAK